MADKLHKYRGKEIEVTFDAKRCIHSAECVRGLPLVFDTSRTPWVLPDAAESDKVAEIVRRCPTGALHYRHVDTALDESTPSENVAVLAKDGPIYLTGDLEILDAGGEVILKDTRIALCRCGASKTKPLCDNAHRKSGFKDSGAIKFVQQDADDPAAHPKLRIQPSPNGPLLIDGDVTIIDSSGSNKSRANSPAFCRCGASGAKPFCDGSHNRVNFSDQ